MANNDNPNGFQPFMNPGGSGKPFIFEFDLGASNSIIGIGDPLTQTSGLVERAAASDELVGIAAEAKAASAGGKIKVWCDPMQFFVAQTDDGTGTATSVGAILANINFVVTDATSGYSNCELDESSATTNAALPFKILRLSPEYSGASGAANAYGEFNRFIVKINNHMLQGGTGTVGT